MKVVVCGSRLIPVNAGLNFHLLDTLAELPVEKNTILLRRPLHKLPEPFEGAVALLAPIFDYELDWRAPEPGGRQQVFLRDVSMVAASDLVVAFFREGDEMTGGTGHIVEKALDQRIPVHAYAVDGASLRLIGSEDFVEGF